MYIDQFQKRVRIGAATMNIAEKSVRHIILLARAYDAKEQIEDLDRSVDIGSEDELVVGDHDRSRDELTAWMNGRDEEALAELVALYWIGRGDFEGRDFVASVREARARRSVPTAEYLLGAPLMGDYLEMGLDAVINAGVYDDA
mgnify:CR=1 FL=1|jgi:hypothetical protein